MNRMVVVPQPERGNVDGAVYRNSDGQTANSTCPHVSLFHRLATSTVSSLSSPRHVIPHTHNTFGDKSWTAGVEQSTILLTTWYQLRTIQMTTENISFWDNWPQRIMTYMWMLQRQRHPF